MPQQPKSILKHPGNESRRENLNVTFEEPSYMLTPRAAIGTMQIIRKDAKLYDNLILLALKLKKRLKKRKSVLKKWKSRTMALLKLVKMRPKVATYVNAIKKVGRISNFRREQVKSLNKVSIKKNVELTQLKIVNRKLLEELTKLDRIFRSKSSKPHVVRSANF